MIRKTSNIFHGSNLFKNEVRSYAQSISLPQIV